MRNSAQSGRGIALATAGALLWFLGLAGAARSETLLPPQFSGIWVQGSCESPERTRLLNAVGVIDFLRLQGAEHLQILLIERVVAKDATTAEIAFARIESAERLTIDLALQDGRLDGIWTRCASLPEALMWSFGEGIAAFRALGDIRAACVTPGKDCMRAIWAYADVTGDGKLSRAEFARIARGFGFFAAYAFHQKPLVRADELILPMAVVPLVARYFVDSLMANADYDGDGLLTVEELTQDRGDPGSAIALLGGLGPAGAQAGVAGTMAAIQPMMKMVFNLLGVFR